MKSAPKQKMYSNTTLELNQLIANIDAGMLGLPELQRPFIWKDSKVRDLFDSMMRGYPIGYFMLWQCPSLEKKKLIGVGEHSYNTPSAVIIDGQQRLTSLYAVIKGKKVLDSKYTERSITISYHPLENKFEVGDSAIRNDKEWVYNISDVFTTGTRRFINSFVAELKKHRDAKGCELTEEEESLIEDNIEALYGLTRHSLPIFDIKANAEEEDVSEIFVRVNSGGVSLKQHDFILTLLSLYWDEGRKLIERFCKGSIDPPKGSHTTSYNQITEVSAQDIIRVVMAYAFNRARLQYGYKLLRGTDFVQKGVIDEEIRNQRFETLKKKLPDVLSVQHWHEFLKSIMNAGYLSGDLILSGNAIFYSYALYLIAKCRFGVSNIENMHLTSLWFFYASLVSLYTSSFESIVEQHLNALKELKSIGEYKNFVLARINEKLTNDYFDITLLGSEGLAVSGRGNNAWNAYVAALNILGAKVLFSKGSLLVSKLFEHGTHSKRKSLEKHHLFPKAYLKQQGYHTKSNQMANYAYIDWKDNMAILDEAPSKYYPKVCEGMSEEQICTMEEENSLPHGWEKMSYEDFLVARRKLMAAKIKEAFEKLKANAT